MVASVIILVVLFISGYGLNLAVLVAAFSAAVIMEKWLVKMSKLIRLPDYH